MSNVYPPAPNDSHAPQQPVYAPPAGYDPAAQVPGSPKGGKNVLGLIAMILAILGLVLACIPGVLILGWILLPISFILGIVGTLTQVDKEYLAQNFAAFFRRDYKRVAELHVESGWVPPDTRVDELEAGIRSVCEPYFDRPLKEISLGMVLLRLFQISRRFNVVIQPQLVLLQKTLLNVEGLGRQLDPDLDLWHTAKPFLEKWMHEQIGPKRLLRELKDQAPYYAKMLPDLPRLLHMEWLAGLVRLQGRALQVHALLGGPDRGGIRGSTPPDTLAQAL